MKRCTECNEIKDLSKFNNAKRGKFGKTSVCKVCINKYQLKRRNTDSYKAKQREWYKNNKGAHRKYRLKREFNLTLDQYNELFTLQNGNCAICEINQKDLSQSLSVDHCHNTGKIRGLLCQKCNSALGLFNDNVNSLIKAIKYLKPNE